MSRHSKYELQVSHTNGKTWMVDQKNSDIEVLRRILKHQEEKRTKSGGDWLDLRIVKVTTTREVVQ